jgi:hypothetical protein
MKQRSSALRRDQSDIFDYLALINNPLSVRSGPDIQSNERNQCRRQDRVSHEHDLTKEQFAGSHLRHQDRHLLTWGLYAHSGGLS